MKSVLQPSAKMGKGRVRKDRTYAAIYAAAKDDLKRYGYFEFRSVLKTAGVILITIDLDTWKTLRRMLARDMKLWLISVNETYFRDFVLVDGSAVEAKVDRKFNPKRYLAGPFGQTAGYVSAARDSDGEIIEAHVSKERKLIEGHTEKTEAVERELTRARAATAAALIEAESVEDPTE